MPQPFCNLCDQLLVLNSLCLRDAMHAGNHWDDLNYGLTVKRGRGFGGLGWLPYSSWMTLVATLNPGLQRGMMKVHVTMN